MAPVASTPAVNCADFSRKLRRVAIPHLLQFAGLYTSWGLITNYLSSSPSIGPRPRSSSQTLEARSENSSAADRRRYKMGAIFALAYLGFVARPSAEGLLLTLGSAVGGYLLVRWHVRKDPEHAIGDWKTLFDDEPKH